LELKARELTAVIKRAIKGSAEDVEKLLRASAKPILFQVLRRVPDRNEAEDVAQKVALLVIKHIGSLKSPHAFSSWLHQIIVRACIAHNQELWRRDNNQSELTPDLPIADEDIAVMPVEATEGNDERTRLYQLIRRLPRAQQEMIVMHYLEGLSYKEIARIQEVGTGTVSKTLSDAKKNLKNMLQKAEQSEVDQNGHAGPGRQDAFPAPARAKGPSGKLGTAALGPAITDALLQQANVMVSSAETERFVMFCHDAVQTNLAAAGATVGVAGAATLAGKISAAFATVAGKAATIALSACVATAVIGGGVYVSTVTAVEKTTITTQEIKTYYAPAATVLLDGKEGGAESVNPSEASIVLADASGVVTSWVLTDESGTVCLSGEGSTVQDDLSTLAPGSYTVEWSVVGKNGATAYVARDFTVEEGADTESPMEEDAASDRREGDAAVEPQAAALDRGTSEVTAPDRPERSDPADPDSTHDATAGDAPLSGAPSSEAQGASQSQ
jgi:RNA polymerase sigma-70 factor (ECF subfamily)